MKNINTGLYKVQKYKNRYGDWRIVIGGRDMTERVGAVLGAIAGISLLLLAILLGGCALVKQDTGEGWSHSGYVRGGIWPRHNESILNHYGDISEGLLEVKETISYNRFNLILNPKFLAGGSWPVKERPTGQVLWNHHGQWIYADLFYTLEYRLNYRTTTGNWYVGYEKERTYELWHDQTGREGNLTYSNMWYLKYTWGER